MVAVLVMQQHNILVQQRLTAELVLLEQTLRDLLLAVHVEEEAEVEVEAQVIRKVALEVLAALEGLVL